MTDESLKHVPQTLLALALASAQEEFTATQARLATATDILEKLLRIVGIEGSTHADLPGLVENLAKVVRENCKLPGWRAKPDDAEVRRRCLEAAKAEEAAWVGLVGATNADEAYDQIRRWRKLAEDEVASTWHFKPVGALLPLCGADEANQASTTIVQNATCPKCIREGLGNQLFVATTQARSWKTKADHYVAIIKEAEALLGTTDDGYMDRIKVLLACEREATMRRWKESL